MIDVRWIAAVSIAVASSSVGAQSIPTPDGVCVDPRGCDPDPIPPPPPPPEPPMGGSASESPTSPGQFDRATLLRRRFADLLRQVRLDSGIDVSDLEGATTLAQIDSRSARLFTRVGTVWSDIRGAVDDRRAGIARFPSYRADLERSYSQSRQKLPELSARASAISAQLARREQIENEQKWIQGIDDLARQGWGRAASVHRDVSATVLALIPSDERGPTQDMLGIIGLSNGPGLAPLRSSPAPSSLPAASPTGTFPQASFMHIPSVLPNLEERMAETARMAEDIPVARALLARLTRESTALYNQVAELRDETANLKSRVDALGLQVQADGAISDRLRAIEEDNAVNRGIAARNLYSAAAAELTWTYIRDVRLTPRLRDWTESSFGATTFTGVEFLAELRENPAKLAHLAGRGEDFQRFADTMLEVVKLGPAFTAYAMDASNALGQGSWHDGRQVLESYTTELDASQRKLLVTATGTQDSFANQLADMLRIKGVEN